MDILTDRNYTVLDPAFSELDARFERLRNFGAVQRKELHRRYGKPYEPPYWRYFFMPAADCMADVPDTALRTKISGRAKDLGQLTKCVKLESLSIGPLNEKVFKVVSQLPSISHLEVSGCTFQNLQFLTALPSLEHLALHETTQIESLEGVGKLTKLRTLVLNGLRNLASLEPLKELCNLQGIEISGALIGINYKIQKFNTLSALSWLRNLKVLRLRALSTLDDDLSPILSIEALEDLQIPPKEFSLDALAVAAAAYPNLAVDWLKPLGSAVPCKRCGTAKDILIGYRTKAICPKCHPRKLNKFFSDFKCRIEAAKMRRLRAQ